VGSHAGSREVEGHGRRDDADLAERVRAPRARGAPRRGLGGGEARGEAVRARALAVAAALERPGVAPRRGEGRGRVRGRGAEAPPARGGLGRGRRGRRDARGRDARGDAGRRARGRVAARVGRAPRRVPRRAAARGRGGRGGGRGGGLGRVAARALRGGRGLPAPRVAARGGGPRLGVGEPRREVVARGPERAPVRLEPRDVVVARRAPRTRLPRLRARVRRVRGGGALAADALLGPEGVGGRALVRRRARGVGGAARVVRRALAPPAPVRGLRGRRPAGRGVGAARSSAPALARPTDPAASGTDAPRPRRAAAASGPGPSDDARAGSDVGSARSGADWSRAQRRHSAGGRSRWSPTCAQINRRFGTSRPDFEILSLGHVEVVSADFRTNRLFSSSSRSTAEELASKPSHTLPLKSG